MSNTKHSVPEHFFILGAAKCGTTTVHHLLAQHPDICMSEPKEPDFFENTFPNGLDFYQKTCFAHWEGERYAGEARHRNLFLRYVPERISSCYPNAKLLIIVRNPVARAYSHYLHRKRHGSESLCFEDALECDLRRIEQERHMSDKELERIHISNLDHTRTNTLHKTYLDTGYYAEQIARYHKYFDQSQLLVLFTEDLKRNPSQLCNRILRFIDSDLPTPNYMDFSRQNENPGRIASTLERILTRNKFIGKVAKSLLPPSIGDRIRTISRKCDSKLPAFRRDAIPSSIRTWLIAHYKPHNKRLEELTGRDLASWNE